MKISSYLPTAQDVTKQIIIGAVVVTLAVIVMRTFPSVKQFYKQDDQS